MDYITITKTNGTKEVMEVVTIFNRTDSDYNYIIYKTLDNSKYFTGKYKGENIVNIDTDLDEEEMEYAKGVFKAVVGE